MIRPKEGEDRACIIAGTTGLYPHWKKVYRPRILLDKQFWRRGYAGERANALLAIVFDRLDLKLVVTAPIDGNEKFRRAISKYVEQYDAQYEGLLRNGLALPGPVAGVHRYTISREKYFEATKR